MSMAIRGGRLSAAVVFAMAGIPAASAQSFYGTGDTFFVPFTNPGNPSIQTEARYVRLTLNTTNGPKTTNFLVDTGSLGIAAGYNNYNYVAGSGDVLLGSGSITYSTSGNNPVGSIYITNVTIQGLNGATARARVPILGATNQADTAQMGIGFDRGGLQLDSGTALPNLNPLLGLTSISTGSVASMAPGYTISFNPQGFQGLGPGIMLGLNQQVSSGFSFVQLTPQGGLPPGCSSAGMGCPLAWNSQTGAVTIGGRNAGTLSMLPDSGIGYMIVNTQQTGIPVTSGTCAAQTSSNPNGSSSKCVPGGTLVTIVVPGPGGSQVGSYSFTVPSVGATPNLATPYGVEVTQGRDQVPFTNLGRAFFEAFDYMYDPIGGFVGYRPSGIAMTNGAVTPMLVLQGNLALSNGFQTTLPTYLLADSFISQNGSGSFNAPIMGVGGLVLQSGNVTLGAANTYSGGTTVNGGTLTVGNGGLIGGFLTVNPGGAFINNGTVASSGLWQVNQGSFTNTGSFQGNLANTGLASNTGTISGSVINGASGWFAQNGAVTGTFSNLGVLNGSGTIVGSLSNTGIVAPGNSIGTLTVGGNFSQGTGGTYAVEVAGSGQSDFLNVGGTATLGGAVNVYVQPGTNLAAHTTYRILGAGGGIAGAFASVNELYPFLRSRLSYDANNTYLTLDVRGFADAAGNPTHAAVGNVLDANADTATGDFAQVLSALATNVLDPGTAQYVLQSLSGNNYAGFASSLVQGAQLFMNNFASQAGGGAPQTARVALAEACEVACDGTAPPRWGAWAGGIGGLGSVGGNAPVGAVTYNAGGFAAGLDRQLTDALRLGVTTGYSAGTQWVSGFAGQGKTDTVAAGLYANYARGPAYLDALAGYAYSANQMWRPLTLPGLQPRTAYGQTGVNQWYGQLEGGWRFDLGTAARAWVTPFARLQAYTGSQNAFTETGAQSLNLSVSQQTTNSLRSVLGAQLGGSLDLGWRERLGLQLRLGWSHEYADVSRPVTAALAAAAAMPFTTYGISPNRDGVVLGLAASTAIAEATSAYVRYEGNVSGQDNAHALTAGLRMTW